MYHITYHDFRLENHMGGGLITRNIGILQKVVNGDMGTLR